MPSPDYFAISQRLLRRARIQDALDLGRQGVDVRRNRNRLLEPLAIESTRHHTAFDDLSDDTVDIVVSLALAELDERSSDALSVVLLCIRILAQDGQFARIALLADRLISIGRVLQVERPFLAAAVSAFSSALRGRTGIALQNLDQRLGLGRAKPTQRPSRSREQMIDVLAATVMRSLLRDGTDAFATEAASVAVSVGDGLLLAFIDAATAWYKARSRADPSAVLVDADPTFASPQLQRYIRSRRIPALYPAQIRAVEGGATLDTSRIVSLPTSSGKTLIAEFRIAATLTRNPGSRALYVAPYRMLSRQVERNFQRSLSRELKISVRDLGSGYDVSTVDDVGDITICTPERLDALLRLATSEQPGSDEAAELFETCRVLVFDELQLIGRPGRGPRFELILSRIRARYPDIEFLGLSAASQGTEDVATWLTTTHAIVGARRPTGTLEIVWETGDSLYQRVSQRPPTKVGELDRGATAIDGAASLILRLDRLYQPVLAICVSRTIAESLAKRLIEADPHAGGQWRDSLSESDVADLGNAVEEVRALLGAEHPLATCMERGIAFHHAGVPTPVLQQIEFLASKRLLRAVSATTTVAEGADLPFRAVVIPHLNFPGPSRRLERDLYLNIIGRAGRANVSVEGIVFLLDSDAKTLNKVVRQSLWNPSAPDRIQGRLSDITSQHADIESWNAFQEVKSQVMGWLGDGNSYIDDQAEAFAEQTFSFQTGDRYDRAAVVSVISDALQELEQSGYALAASPYQLTERGGVARLTGLSTASVSRLEHAVGIGRNGWMTDLIGIDTITAPIAQQISALLFEAVEMFEHTLWMRRAAGSTPAAKLAALLKFAEGEQPHGDSDEFGVDVELLSSWLLGSSYPELAGIAPTYKRQNMMFGGEEESKRTSDATEYIGKLVYPATWVWSAVHVVASDLAQLFPSFIGRALEYGVPSEAAARLVQFGSLTRPTALLIAEHSGPAWTDGRAWVIENDPDSQDVVPLTRLDARRLRDLRERLLRSRDPFMFTE